MKKLFPRMPIIMVLFLFSIAAVPLAQRRAPAADLKLTLGIGDFVPNTNSATFSRSFNAYLTSTGALIAPAHLPGTKLVTEVKIHYEDDNAGASPCFWVIKSKPGTGEKTNLANGCGSGTTGGQVSTFTLSGINEVIVPSDTLFVWIGMASDIKIYGAKVFYRNP